jgi:hypothetical protein
LRDGAIVAAAIEDAAATQTTDAPPFAEPPREEHVQCKQTEKSIWAKYGVPSLEFTHPEYGHNRMKAPEVREAVRRSFRIADPTRAVPINVWRPTTSTTGPRNLTSAAPAEADLRVAVDALQDLEVKALEWHLGPARLFCEGMAKSIGAAAIEWFGSRYYGPPLPGSDADLAIIIPANVDASDLSHEFAAHLTCDECRRFGFTQV